MKTVDLTRTGLHLYHSCIRTFQNVLYRTPVLLQALACSHFLFTSSSSLHLHGKICKRLATGMVEDKQLANGIVSLVHSKQVI